MAIPSAKAHQYISELMEDPIACKARVMAIMARRSFASFVKQAWPIFEPAPLTWNWHLDAICEHLEAVAKGEIKRIIFNVPPRSSKSNLSAILFPAWVWISNPRAQFFFLSYSATLSVEHSVKCRQVIESPWYRENYARDWSLRADQNVKHDFMNTMGGRRLATSITGGIVGRGGDYIIIDDPLNAEDAHSKAARDQAMRVIGEATSTRLNDPKTGRVVLIMQRLHQDDPTQFLLNGGGYEHFMLPSEYEPERQCVTHRTVHLPANGSPARTERQEFFRDPRTQAGELLFPARFPKEVIERLKQPNALGSMGYAGQHQQRPAPEEGGMFKVQNWRFWQPDEVTRTRLGYLESAVRPRGCFEGPPTPTSLDDLEEIILSVDATFRETKGGSYVVIQAWGKIKARRLLLYMVRKRMDFTDTVKEMLKVIELFPQARRKLIEGKANGDAIISTLERTHGISGCEAVPVSGDKVKRAYAMQPYQSAGNVELPDGAPWTGDHVMEHANFPNAANDDIVDAQSQGLQGLEHEKTAADYYKDIEL